MPNSEVSVAIQTLSYYLLFILKASTLHSINILAVSLLICMFYAEARGLCLPKIIQGL